MDRPPIVVAGFGRCGSSLVMQMLHAGGIRCTGNYPSFESGRAAVAGAATKILDPHINPVPLDARVIWLDRNAGQQIASHDKFMRALTGIGYDRSKRRRAFAVLVRDRKACMRSLANRPMLLLSFEGLLADPVGSARLIAEFVGGPFDALKAAAQVLHREPRCAPDLGIELRLMGVAA